METVRDILEEDPLLKEGGEFTRRGGGIPVVFLGDSLERRLLEEEVIPLSKSSKGGLSS